MSENPTDIKFIPASSPRVSPRLNVLENKFLHKLFLLTHAPAGWPTWQLVLLGLGYTLLAAVGWGLAGYNPALPAIICALFILGDGLLFRHLPRARRSFGAIGPQLVVTAVPRVGAAWLAALVAWATGAWAIGLGLLVGLQLFGSMVYLWGALREPFALGVTKQTVVSPHLSAAGPPLRLLHLSDLHMERLTCREESLPALAAQLQPDVIVITGDYLNLSYVDDPTAREHVRRVLAQLHAPLGVYATLGSPPVDRRGTTPSLFEGLDIRLLRDEVALLSLSEGGQVALLGLDCEHDLESDSSALRGLVGQIPAGAMPILLYHSPELMPLAQQFPIELYLCGHTHGGQIRMPGYGAVLTSSSTGKRYEMGRYDEQGTTLYVSRGIGLEGLSAPRMRLLCPPEIILFTLVGER
jgi:hypothetical protein